MRKSNQVSMKLKHAYCPCRKFQSDSGEDVIAVSCNMIQLLIAD